MLGKIQYHLSELAIAKDLRDPRQSAPDIPKSARIILDIGCGIGQSLVALNLRNVTLSVGLDIDFECLSYGRKQINSIDLVNGSGNNLPFKDSSFDFIFSRVSLPYTNIPKSICEISRVVKVNGKI